MKSSSLNSILFNISQARKKSTFSVDEQPVQLIAVSKKKKLDQILELYHQGVRDFAENYVQEALEKLSANPPADIRWHFIGKLQSNKVKFVVGRFHLIHSVDSFKVLQHIQAEAARQGISQDVLLQINIANEETKGGFSPDDLLNKGRSGLSFENVNLRGLMIFPPLSEDREISRRYFHEGRKLLDKFNSSESSPISLLSMGTTSDYEVAIEEGANMIRIGTALFGERNE